MQGDRSWRLVKLYEAWVQRKLLQGEKRKSENKSCRVFTQTASNAGQKIPKNRRRAKIFNCRKSSLCKLNGVLIVSIAPKHQFWLNLPWKKG